MTAFQPDNERVNENAGRDIGQRIISRELVALQGRFIEQLQLQRFGRLMTLTGAAAFRGVYLKQPWGARLDFEAPSVVAYHFAESIHRFNIHIERKQDHFSIIGKSVTSRDISFPLIVSVPGSLPPPPESGLFYSRRDKPVNVRVTPISTLLVSMLQRLRMDPSPADMLDLWLFCGLSSQSLTQVLSLTPDAGNPIAALSVAQIRSLKERWQIENVGTPCILPPFKQVYKDLRRFLTSTSPIMVGAEILQVTK